MPASHYPSSPDAGRPPSPGWTLALASLASFIVALDALVVTTSLATIREHFQAAIGDLQWTVNAYNLCLAVLLMTGAALGDRFGRRRMLAAGIVLFMTASAACALAGSMGELIAGRALQGAGAALVMPLAMALLSAAYPREQRARALGVFGGVTGLALIVGPVVGGAIAQGLAWQWIFWINIPIGLTLLPLVLTRIRESRGPAVALDLPGVLLVTAAALGAAWALLRGHAAGWASVEVATALALALLAAAGFVRREQRAPEPMVPLRLFRSRPFASGTAVSFLLYAPMYGTLFFLPQFLQAQGSGPLDAGLRLIPWTATLFFVAPLAGRAAARFGERPLIVAGLTLQAAGIGWISLVAAATAPGHAELVLPLIVSGVGVSMAMPAAQNVVLSAVAPAEIGKASGVFNMARCFGGVFGVALLVEVFARAGGAGSAGSFAAGFVPAMRVAAALSLLGALAGLPLPASRKIRRNGRDDGMTPSRPARLFCNLREGVRQ